MPSAVGMVLEQGRGSLPYSLVHGEPMVRCAALALEQAGIHPVDADTSWPLLLDLFDEAESVVFHDALCPLTPPAFLAQCVRRAVANNSVVVAFRPVTDTVKHVERGEIGGTVSRDRLRALASPVVLPTAAARRLPGAVGHDLSGLITSLARGGGSLDWVEAPAAAGRVRTRDDVGLLEALTRS